MAEKPLILVVETVSTVGGGERALLQLIPAIQRRFRVTFAIPGPGVLRDELDRLGIAHEILPVGDEYTMVRKTPEDVWNFATSMPAKTRAVIRCLRRLKPSIVLLNSVPSFPWGTLAGTLSKTPVIWYVHNLISDKKSLYLLRPWSRFRAVRSVVAASEQAAQQFHAVRKAEVVRPCVDFEAFAPDAALGEKLRRSLATPEEKVVFATIGELTEAKGHHVAIRAARKVAESMDIELWVVGGERDRSDPVYASRLRQEAENAPFVRFLGYRTDVPAILNAVDCLLVPSQMETGPLVLLEALACAVPVVSTPVGLAPDLLRDGTCGYLVPFGSAGEMAERMLRLARAEERMALGDVGRQRVLRGYSIESGAARILAVLSRASGLRSLLLE